MALGDTCDSADDCTEPLACHEAACRGLAGFSPCDKPGQCVTGRCQGNACQEQVSLGDTCDSEDDCRSPLTCSSGFCLIPVGQKCTASLAVRHRELPESGVRAWGCAMPPVPHRDGLYRGQVRGAVHP